MRTNRVKQLLKSGQPAVGTWLSLANVPAARYLARSGFDWLCVDCEHSHAGIETTSQILGAVADAGCVPIARVPSNRHDHIKRILDNGGYGVVVPMVNSKQDALEAVSACLYPPRGTRSVGGNLHALNFDATPATYFAKANEEILVVLQCEHIEAVRNFDEVFGVSGIDAVFVGPNDLMASMRDATGMPPSADIFEQTLQTILAGCKRRGVAAGLHTFSANEARMRIDQGWHFIAVGSELKFMLDGAADVLAGLGRNATDLAKY